LDAINIFRLSDEALLKDFLMDQSLTLLATLYQSFNLL